MSSTITRKSDIPKKKITLGGLKNALQLYRFIKPYRTIYFIGLFFLFGSSLANLAFPKLLGDLVNAGDMSEFAQEINRIALIIFVLLIIQATFSYFRVVLFVRVTERTLADLRTFTYRHLIKLPLSFFNKHRVGELNSRLSADIALLQETLTSTLAEFLRQIIIIVGGITLLIITSFKLTLFMLAVLPVVVLLSVFFGRFIRTLSKKAQNKVAESNTIVEETLQGIQSVKTYTNEQYEIKRYKEKTDEIADVGIAGGKYRGAFSSFIIFGLFGALVAVIWKGAMLMAAGELESGQLFSFVLYSGFIGGTIGGMANVYSRIQRFLGATEDIFEILKTPEEEITEVTEVEDAFRLEGKIRFDQVNFTYPSRKNEQVIQNISFSIEKNQMVALVGPSGAGKSTIASLLLRLYEPTDGNIFYDALAGGDIPLSQLREQIALVPQDTFLFGGSIRENIAYGKPGAHEDEIVEAAKKANAWEFIERFPKKMETIVGERGTQLSGGQRQRISIARAILKSPKILILDEATSSLDSASEKMVQEAMEKLMEDRTSIVIAHRLSTIKKADKILVLEHGRLVEQGTHEALKGLEGGLYNKLRKLQEF
jgi:ABC-type multidrug transport system fused ATPase/permease subunit